VLLVIIIFLMLTTTYAKFSGLEINLPTADASKQERAAQRSQRCADGGGPGAGQQGAADATSVQAISEALRRAAGDAKEPVIVINADAKANAPERRRYHAGGADGRLSAHFLRHQSPR
jgi:biopolymer transport protein ExbD